MRHINHYIFASLSISNHHFHIGNRLIVIAISTDISKAALASSAEKGEEEGDISKSVMMARAYVRLWLALREVQVRDPHSVVATAAAAVIRRVTVQLDKDMDKSQRRKDSMDRTPSSPSSRPGPMASGAPRERDSPGPGQSLFSPSFGVNRGKSPSLLNMYSVGGAGRDDSGSNPWDRGGPILPPGPSPLPPSMSAQEITRRRGAAPSPANRTGTRPSSSAVNRGPSPNPSFGSSKFPTGTEGNGAAVGVGPMMNTPDQSSGSNYFGAKRSDGIISASSLAGISDLGATGIAQNNNIRSDSFQTFDDEEEPIEYEKDPALTSCLYTWSRKLFLTPAPGHEPYSDPLSLEGCSRLYRDSKLNEILRHEQKLSDIFKYVDDKEDLLQLDRKMKEDLQSAKTTMVAALPSSVTKFEQKAVLNIETAEVTSLVMFHSFHDILAVSDGYGVGIWSLACGSRIMQIPNLSGYRNQSSSSNTASYRDNHRKYSLSLNEKDKGGNTDRAAGSGEGSLSGRIPQGLGGISPGLGASLIISTGTLAEGSAGQAQGTAGIAAAVAGRTRTGSFSLLPSHVTPSAPLEGVARVTAMLWINETYESLLLMGSDDGSVKVWKDSADTETIAAHNSSIQSNQTQTDSQKEREMDRSSSSSNFRDGAFKGPVVTASSARLPRSIYGGFYNSSEACNTGASLASAFIALPDVAQDSRGSGMVLSWIQPSGTLVAGGNSSTIRVWDVGREQCVRVFDTGLDTCTTAIASRTVAMDFSSTSHMSGYPYGSSPSFTPSPFKPISDMPQLVSWTFAGSADGTVSVFDERVPSTAVHGGRVHCSRDHSAWIVSAHLRADGVPQVITGSVRGVVKFWDLRSMRTFKTFEVHKSPLTALAVHSCAPIIATGSHAQFIKILTLGGDQLGSIIKYHDGFLGQRIGPVSCLAFHPTRMRLAAGATDSIVSIYTTASDM